MLVEVWHIFGNPIPGRVTPEAQWDAYIKLFEHEFPDEVVPCVFFNRMWQEDLQKYMDYYTEHATGKMGVMVEQMPVPYYYWQSATDHEKYRQLFDVNYTRNIVACRTAIPHVDYVFVFDARTAMTEQSWEQLLMDLATQPETAYYMTGQAQLMEGEDTGKEFGTIDFWDGPDVLNGETRQYFIGFGKDHDIEFNEELLYGENSREELLACLGVPGPWLKKFDKVRHTEHYKKIGKAGYAITRTSGYPELDKNPEKRKEAQINGRKLVVAEYERRFPNPERAND